MCTAALETTLHVLVRCPFAVVCWRQTKVPAVAPAAMLFMSWFEAGLISSREEESVEAAMVLWSIWNTINDVVWNAKIPMMEEVIQLAKITYVDWFNAQKADADIPKDYHEPRSDKWKAPEFPIIEAKTVCKLGALQPHEVEAMGMKEAFSWIKANAWQDVIVESDCLQVISDLHCNKNMSSPYGHIISDCKALFAEIDNVSLCFVKRSANRVAHCLARSSLGEADHIFSSHSLPTVIASLVRDDLS
uniref:RNase H type-1 domain-containing protein n=1 Tax=Cannabis sativa TaxID=3483 RepID=A0A803PIQ4_CANSA